MNRRVLCRANYAQKEVAQIYDFNPFHPAERGPRASYPGHWPRLFEHFMDAEFVRFHADLKETPDSVIVEAELPGVDRKNIDIEVSDSYLTIKLVANQTEENSDANYIRRERRYGESQRRFYVGEIMQDQVTAEYRDGILKVTLPKKAGSAQNTRKVDIH